MDRPRNLQKIARFFYRLSVHLFAVTAGFAITILCACSMISLRQSEPSFPFPPQATESGETAWEKDPVQVDHALEKRYRDNPSEPTRLLVRYSQAKLWAVRDPAKACSLWLETVNQPRFPLASIALLRAFETCPIERLKQTQEKHQDLPTFDELEARLSDPWLREPFLRAALTRSIQLGDRERELKYNEALVAFEPLKRQKEERLKHIIDLETALKAPPALLEETQLHLKQVAPRFNTSPTMSEYFEVAGDFKQAREFEASRTWYEKIIASDDFSNWEKLRALGEIRMTFKLQKKTDDYLRATHRLSRFAYDKFFRPGRSTLAKSPEAGRSLLNKYLSTQLTLARAVWTESSATEANKILKTTERQLRGLVSLHESLFTRARIEEEQGHFKEMARVLDQIRLADLSDREFRSKVEWAKAWNLRRLSRRKDAIEALQSLTQNESNPALLARDRFWLAKTLAADGQNAQAQQNFQLLIDTDVLSWYGLLAFRELGQPLPPLGAVANMRAPSSEKNTGSSDSLLTEEKLMVEWLISVGEMSIARDFLNSVTEGRRAAYTEAQALDLLQLYARTGNYQTLFARLYELPAQTRKNLVETHPELLFPQPFKALVGVAAKRFDVHPELIYAIMRQESSFNPNARSFADAFGLMQLIPEMAKRAGPAAGLKLSHQDDLYKPETNIPLGTAFLRELLNHWQNGFVTSVASYNASERAISSWLKTRFRGDALEFIEDVPYEETRNYIKLVMRNYIFYSRLNSGGQAVPFPEWCLANLQGAKL